jgi:predicted nucleic acid-binding protein
LGRGESEVIEYARLHPGTIALIDDRSARKVAEAIGIKVYGTLSIVARQAARDRTLSFELLVECLKKAGMYIDDKIILSVKTSLQHR